MVKLARGLVKLGDVKVLFDFSLNPHYSRNFDSFQEKMMLVCLVFIVEVLIYLNLCLELSFSSRRITIGCF